MWGVEMEKLIVPSVRFKNIFIFKYIKFNIRLNIYLI